MPLHRILRSKLAPFLTMGMLVASSAHAVLDVNDRGPSLDAGNFVLRVTNAGILGNAFPVRSADFSFEFPAGSGQDCLKHAGLWVGALGADGRPRVSGDPLLEWRPTPDPDDRVRFAVHGQPGTRNLIDDDDDGAVDEERLNGRDDDGDGEVDEDLNVFAHQMAAAQYVDDRPEGVNFHYGTENHAPLGLEVFQETFTWSIAGHDGIAAVRFTITNRSDRALHELYVGLFADLDSKSSDDPAGHVDDEIVPVPFARDIPTGSYLTYFTRIPFSGSCLAHVEGTPPAVMDDRNTALPTDCERRHAPDSATLAASLRVIVGSFSLPTPAHEESIRHPSTRL